MKPINLSLSKLKQPHKKHSSWPMETKIAVVSQYLVLGNMALVSAVTGVPHQLIRAWKALPWWKEVEMQVRATENLQMDNKLSKIVDKSLDAVLDRVENGEYFYDQKTGQVKRKPVNLRDVARVSVDILSKRELLRGNATERKETTQVSVADQLKELALEFAKWQSPQKQIQETIDVDTIVIEDITETDEDNAIYDQRETGLQERGSQVHEQTISGEEADGTERSTGSDGESGKGS